MWNFGPARQCGAIYQSRIAVSTKKRGLSVHIELDVAQNGVLRARDLVFHERAAPGAGELAEHRPVVDVASEEDRKSTRLNSSHQIISYAVFCLKKKKHCHFYIRE